MPQPILPPPPPVNAYPTDPALDWLVTEEDVAQLGNDEVLALLAAMDSPTSDDDLYTYALLQQQLDTFEGWIRARDTFATLLKSRDLFPGQRRLIVILQDRCQSRINAHITRRELGNEKLQLQQALELAQEEKQLLEQKIQALTDIEAVISTRREE